MLYKLRTVSRADSADLTPDWTGLMEVARARAGFFSADEAQAHRISPQLLRYRVGKGWVSREMRGVYRFVSASPTEHDELIALWLWSGEEAVFSHVTALSLHDLSDALPARVHMTVPPSWRYARFAKPSRVTLHVADLPSEHVQWLGYVPVTTPARTIADCIATHVDASWIEQAITQARTRKLITATVANQLHRARRRSAA
jgi:predicted transcriptional regulator of viral defense system